jgi:hypothetical protein
MIRIEQCYAGGAGVSKKGPNWRQQQAWGDSGGGRANIKDQNAKIQGKNQNVGKRRVPCRARDDGRESFVSLRFFIVDYSAFGAELGGFLRKKLDRRNWGAY